MTIASRPLALASLLLAGLAHAPALRAQDVASSDVESTKPELQIIQKAVNVYAYRLVAGTKHAGEPVFLMLSASKDPMVALTENAVLEAHTLDASGSVQGVVSVGAGGQPLVNNLSAVIIGQQGSLVSVAAVAPGATPQNVQTQPGGIVCLVPPPPPCTGGQLPDLIITNVKFSTTLTSTVCTGAPLPRLMCGANGFDVTVTVKNIGTCAVPCMTDLTVLFGKGPSAGNLTFDPLPVTVKTDDILPGETFQVSRHFFLGPCTGTLNQLQFYGAIVDSAGTIAELNEGNNAATPVAGCEIL